MKHFHFHLRGHTVVKITFIHSAQRGGRTGLDVLQMTAPVTSDVSHISSYGEVKLQATNGAYT